MDWEAFESDVWDSVNTSLYAFQEGSLDDSDPDGGYTGKVVTMGETWLGALYVATEDYYGNRRVELFDTRAAQGEFYDRETADFPEV